jgi:signal transduction histidine kinase
LVYFLIAELGLGLYGQTNWVSVFWPAFGVSAGILIALGPSARLQVAIGIIAAIVVAHLIIGDPRWLGPAFALSDAAEALVTAGIVHHFFGASFSLDRLSHVFGLLAAAMCGSMASFSVWIVAAMLFQSSMEPILTTWQHWFMGDMVGFVALGPFVIGLFAAIRQPPGWIELIEGILTLLVLAVMTAIVISRPPEVWQTLVPVAWLFPILFWLAARCRPIFTAAGACMVSITVVWTTVFGIGHFGNAGLPVDERNLQAQATILVVALGAFILSALFAERKENEARLAHSNMMLQRERENRLMNVQAALASVAHEVRQPLSAVTTMSAAARRWLQRVPPNMDMATRLLGEIEGAGFRASEVLTNVRKLFEDADHKQQPIDANNLIRETLQTLHGELNDHGVKTDVELASELPLVIGNGGQLQEVISNLVHNAIDAMAPMKVDRRTLKVRTKPDGGKAVIIEVEDTGHGIEPERLGRIFEPFVTTKPHGTGLGLAICSAIIERHGGRLTASSESKSGALFQIVLPVERTLTDTVG